MPLPRPKAAPMLFAISLAAQMLGGCACTGLEWEGVLATEAEASGAGTLAECEAGDLASFSAASAEFAGRADPRMLAVARREAERECYEATTRRGRGNKPASASH